MPYHILISDEKQGDKVLLDRLLGSAVVVDFYWESIGRELNLPLISSIMERADSEEGFSLTNGELLSFRDELDIFEAHWRKGVPEKGVPDGFFEGLGEIRKGIESAIKLDCTLFIC